MAGCDGSLSSKECKQCNGSGFKIIPIIDPLSKRLKPTAAACLGKMNETAEAYYSDVRGLPEISESDLKKVEYGLENYVFTGDISYVNFAAKKLIVKNYYNNNFRVSILSSSLLIENYSTEKMSLSEYQNFDLVILTLGKMAVKADTNNIFKAAVFELVKLRVLNRKPVWLHVPKDKSELAACLEYSADLDIYIRDFKLVKKLTEFSMVQKSNISDKFKGL